MPLAGGRLPLLGKRSLADQSPEGRGEILDRGWTEVALLAIADGDVSRLDLLVADDEHEWDLAELRFANLEAHFLTALVDADAESPPS